MEYRRRLSPILGAAVDSDPYGAFSSSKNVVSRALFRYLWARRVIMLRSTTQSPDQRRDAGTQQRKITTIRMEPFPSHPDRREFLSILSR